MRENERVKELVAEKISRRWVPLTQSASHLLIFSFPFIPWPRILSVSYTPEILSTTDYENPSLLLSPFGVAKIYRDPQSQGKGVALPSLLLSSFAFGSYVSILRNAWKCPTLNENSPKLPNCGVEKWCDFSTRIWYVAGRCQLGVASLHSIRAVVTSVRKPNIFRRFSISISISVRFGLVRFGSVSSLTSPRPFVLLTSRSLTLFYTSEVCIPFVLLNGRHWNPRQPNSLDIWPTSFIRISMVN